MSEIVPAAVPPAPVVAPVPEPVSAPSAAPKGGSSLNASHVAGGGFGAIIGAAVVGVIQHFFHAHVSDVDAAVVGSAALSAGVGLGHIIGKVGVFGLFRVLAHGGSAANA